MSDTKMIMEKLTKIENDISYIRHNMIDVDTILTTEEAARLDNAIKDHKEGKSIPFSTLKRR